MNKKLLIIEDSKKDRELIKSYLSSENFNYKYSFVEAENSSSGMHYYLNGSPDCTILDYNLNDNMDGLEILKEFEELGKLNTPIIFITSFGSKELLKKCLSSGAFLYFEKNELDKNLLSKAVEILVYQNSLRKSQ